MLDRYYLGHTTESLQERLRKHLSDHKGRTARTRDWALMHSEEFADRSVAYRRELEAKKWKNRSGIEHLIGKPR